MSNRRVLILGLFLALITSLGLVCPVGATYYPSPTGTPLSVDLNLNLHKLTGLTDILSEGPEADVRAFGAVGDGVTDNTAAIQAAISSSVASSAAGGCVYFPHGVYMTGPINLVNGLCIRGDGVGVSTIKLKNGANDSLIKGSTTYNIWSDSFHDISFDGNAINQTAGNGMDLTGVEQYSMHNCSISNTYKDGIYCNGLEYASGGGCISDLLIQSPGLHGLEWTEVWTTRANDIYVENAPKGWGFLLSQCGESMFTCCGANQCVGGFCLYGTLKISFSGCQALYSTGAPGFLVEASCSGIILNGCEAINNSSNTAYGIYGLEISNSTETEVTGCRFNGNNQGGILETGSSNSNILMGIDATGNPGGSATLTSGTSTFAMGIAGRDSGIKGHLTATTTWSPGAMASGAVASTTISVPGANVGDIAYASHTQIGGNNILISAYVQAANTVRVVLENSSSSTVTIASGTLRANVWRY